MAEAIADEFDDALNTLAWDSEDQRYVGGIAYNGWELLDSIGPVVREDDEDVLDLLAQAFNDVTWSHRDPYGLSDREVLSFSWDAFCALIQHRARFFFQNATEDAGDDSQVLRSSELLAKIAEVCEQLGLIQTLPAGTIVYRARRPSDQRAEKLEFRSSLEFGPPPEPRTTTAQRMSPPGIPMLYAALDMETAAIEVAYPEPIRCAVAKLLLLRPARVLNFEKTSRHPQHI